MWNFFSSRKYNFFAKYFFIYDSFNYLMTQSFVTNSISEIPNSYTHAMHVHVCQYFISTIHSKNILIQYLRHD